MRITIRHKLPDSWSDIPEPAQFAQARAQRKYSSQAKPLDQRTLPPLEIIDAVAARQINEVMQWRRETKVLLGALRQGKTYVQASKESGVKHAKCWSRLWRLRYLWEHGEGARPPVTPKRNIQRTK